ncbi:hypothetical protein D3C72_1707110 [compost metagenome]
MAQLGARPIGAMQIPLVVLLRHAQGQAGPVGQVGRRLRQRCTGEQQGAAHHALAPFGQHAQHQVAVGQRRRTHADGHVDALGHQIDASVARFQ